MSGNSLKDCTAVIRLKDEVEWLNKSVDSIVEVFGSILLCTQGEQSDATDEWCARWAEEWEHISHLHYPHEVVPNGPDYASRCVGVPSENTRHHFYNWCFAAAGTPWVCKWDGDMIACDNLQEVLESRMDDTTYAIKFLGVDLAGDLLHVGEREFCATEPRLYRNDKRTAYVAGSHCEQIMLPSQSVVSWVTEPLFFHTKWLKSEYSITKAWPDNWKEIPHFQKLWERKQPVKTHGRLLPECLRK